MTSLKKISNYLFILLFIFPTLCFAQSERQETAAESEKIIIELVNALLVDNNTKRLVKIADKLQSQNAMQGLVLYLAAMREDPTEIEATYQVAALLSRMGNYDLAGEYLEIADKRGLWFAPVMSEDDDFEQMMDHPSYKKVLANAQARYPDKARDKVGAMSYILPPQKASEPVVDIPKNGFPVLVWLHGYGANNNVKNYEILASTGTIIMGVNGSTMLSDEQSFRWSTIDSAQNAVQSALDKLATEHSIDRNRVYLMGFSQGALYAGGLLANYPQNYAGAILISVGGNDADIPKETNAQDKRIVVIYGSDEYQSNIDMTQQFEKLFEKNNKTKSYIHDGQHHFPADWGKSLPESLLWLQNIQESSK